MRKQNAYSSCSSVHADKLCKDEGKISSTCKYAVQTLHNMELILTTTSALWLICSWPAAASELEPNPASIFLSNSPLLNNETNNQLGKISIELKAASVKPNVKIAAITFLPDWLESANSGDFPPGIDINIDSKWCEDEGYLLTCPANMAKVPDKDCPRDHNYGTCSLEQLCKNNGYVETPATCKKKGGNYYVDTTQKCTNGQNFYKKCIINNPQGCKDAGYVNSCSSGRMYQNSNKCPYDSSYGKCCTAAPSTGCPSGYTVSCTGTTSGTDTCGYTCKQCCSYSTTSSYCYNRCLFTGSSSCVINGTTYYSGCGLSKCGSNESCSSGTCNCVSGYIDWCKAPETNCTTLGYTKTASQCSSGALKCPYDTSKVFCM